jgi:methyl-accepting chemotaxis protein
MNINSWTISRRIITGFAACLLITAGLEIFAVRQINNLNTNIEDLIANLNDNIIPSMALLSEISDQSRDIIIILEQLKGEPSPERVAQLEKKNIECNARVEECLKKYEPLVANEEDRRLLKEVRRNFETFNVAGNRALELIHQNQTFEISQQMQSVVLPSYEKLKKSISEHSDFNTKLGSAQAATAKLTAKTAVQWARIILICALLATAAIAWTISSSTNRILRDFAASLEHGALQTAAAARQVSVASQTLSSGASEQASSVEETSASLEEMTSMIRATSENAQKAKQLALESRTVANAGFATMAEMDMAIAEMNQAMVAIDISSAEVAKIVKNIDEIAFQTNILALNAAVEAARAGEAGAGFAVVADEVRSLAQRSAAAAKETASKIENAIASSRRGSESCLKGTSRSSKVSESLKHIAEKISSTDSLVGEIANAAREQSQGIAQINSAITQVEKVTQRNAASAEESASASEELSAQAETLKDLIAKLRKLVGGENLSASLPQSFHRSNPFQERPPHFSAENKPKTRFPMPGDQPVKSGSADGEFRNF